MNHPHPGLLQGIHPQALAVQREGADGSAAACKDALGLGVAGIFHAIAPLPAQKLYQKANQGLRPRPHHDLLRVRPDAPEAIQVLRNGPPQGREALGVGGGQEGGGLLGEHLPHELGPGGEGKEGNIHRAGGEVIGEGRRGRGRHGQGAGRSGRAVLLLYGLNKKAPLGLRAEVALRQKLAVGPLHRYHADFQVGCQRPLGGQALSGGETARLDLPPDIAVELFVEGAALAAVQNRRKHGDTSKLT